MIVLATAVVSAIILTGFTLFAPANGKRLRVTSADRQLLVAPSVLAELIPGHRLQSDAESCTKTKYADGTVVLLYEYDDGAGVSLRCRIQFCTGADDAERAYSAEVMRIGAAIRQLGSDVTSERSDPLVQGDRPTAYFLVTRQSQLVGIYFAGHVADRVLSVEVTGSRLTQHGPLTAEILDAQTRLMDASP